MLSLDETVEFLRHCHRQAPFLLFNGNTFADVACQITAALFAELPTGRRREVMSAVAMQRFRRGTHGPARKPGPGQTAMKGIGATKKLPGEGFKRSWPPLIKMDPAVKAKVEKLFNSGNV